MVRLSLAVALAAVLAMSVTTPMAATRERSATVTIALVTGADGACYLSQTASWEGYRVNRVRHIWYEVGQSGPYDYFGFTTSSYPNGESHSSGSFTSGYVYQRVYADERYYAHALFRSNGGAILAEAVSAPLTVSGTCGTRPLTA